MLDKKQEESILEFWKKNKIYEKVKKKNIRGKKFYFMDGPPYASGDIHMGTALNKILKDIAMRMKRMQGLDVFDRPGYDTHGVPIEYQVEKEIGSKNKQDIEKYGVEKFVKRCKEFATQYIDVMNSEFINLGVWMDWSNPYLTLNDEYIEVIWGAFKAAEKKGLLYLGTYPVHICPRCETAVAYNEIEYKKQRDISIYVKFPLKHKKNTFLLIWTTTPWTLPGNTGVMVHPDLIYQEVEVSNGERWILAKELLPKVMAKIERGYTVKDEYKGKDMEGWKYENPLAKYTKLKVKNAYRVVLSARYVTTEEGTGLVHTAPGHGKEDYEVGKETGLDAPCPIDISGSMTEEAGKYAGKKARIVDAEIIDDLEKEGFLVYKLEYEHDYPLCWRDKTPLLMVSLPQWFLKISKIQKKLLEENEKVNWTPKYMELRMKAWLEGIGDWPVSRQRYWGTPLPIWFNKESGERIVTGSIEELKKFSGKKEINIHKPEIDNIVIKRHGKEFRRVPEVLDVWFDSGVSSWAALDYLKNKDKFKKYWPADLNVEGRDQFRGWWNSQIILSETMFNKKPFENILVHGFVLDVEKSKMSKSKGNIVSPQEVINNFGRDLMRYYFAKFSKGEDFSYDENEFNEIKKFMAIFLNVNNFINQLENNRTKLEIEDKWLLSRYNSMLKEITENYNSFKFPEVIQKFESFVIELSRNYIQMIRERADEVYDILNGVRIGLLKVIAPIMPFITEKIWQELREKKIVKEESIHLSELPKFDAEKIDKKLEAMFEAAFEVITKGLAERDKEKIGLRWPLAKAIITLTSTLDPSNHLREIIARQLNVKEVELKLGNEFSVKLDTKSTPELESEGYARELARKIQSERKSRGMKKGDLIELKVYASDELIKMLKTYLNFLKERTNSKKIEFLKTGSSKKAISFEVKDKKIGIEF